MREMRRKLMVGLAVGISFVAGAELLFAQRHVPKPNVKQQSSFPNSIVDEYGTPLDPKTVKAAVLRQNEQEFRESVEKLSVLVNELREEMEKGPATDVLSVKTYKKAQEIEKLAKLIKNKAKG